MSQPESNAPESARLGEIKFLVVDDEANIRILQKNLLMSLGHSDVEIAVDGREALQILGQDKVDVLLLDLKMPGMDGYQVARKAVQLWPDMVILVVTAFATITGAVDLMKVGVYDLLEKPFKYDQFKEKIAKAVDEHRRRAAEREERNKKRNFGKYLILSELSRGGMGIVYKARDSVNENVVALKVLATHFKKQEQVARFYLEGDTISKLSHPGIVTIYELGIIEGQHFISMEFIEGKSLYDLIYSSVLTYKKGISILADLLEAVAYAHSKGVIHRDLKPSNVLVDESANPHLIDFGLAKTLKSGVKITQTDLILGTFGYLAPERLSGENVDHQSDIFSVGVILYEMLTHRLPYEKDNEVNVFPIFTEAVLKPSQVNPKVPEFLEKVCLKAIAVEKADRYATAEDFKVDLERFLEHYCMNS